MFDYVLRKIRLGFTVEFIGQWKWTTINLFRWNDSPAIQLNIGPLDNRGGAFVLTPREAIMLGHALIDIAGKKI